MHPTPADAPRRSLRHPHRRARRLLATLLAALVAGLPGPRADVASASTRGPVATPAVAAPPAAPLPASRFARRLSGEVYGYLPYWEINSGTDAYLRYDLLTDIALFSVGLTSSGAVSTSGTGYGPVTGSTAATIVSHAHAAGVRVDLTVTSFGLAKNSAFFGNPTAMAAAVTAISNLVQSEGLDGVSLDVEMLENVDFAAYGVFVGQLRTKLRSWNPDARVSVATNGSLSGAGMAVQALKNGADRVFIMGYSYRTSGTSPAGSISPIARADGGKSLSWTLDLYASKGVPADRILLGLPYYGRSWHTTSGELHATTTSSAGVFIPSDDLAAIPAGTAINHDLAEGSRWFAVRDSAGTWTQTYYDDPMTLRAKYGLASRRGLAGIGIWTLGYDRGVSGYWDAIVASFGTVRKAGPDRYATAAAIARDAFASPIEVAFVATGADFPDALAAAAVAGASRAPVLLVTKAAIPAATTTELQRLKPQRIIVVGGPAAVSDAVLGALGALAPGGATRLSGPDRYATAAAVSAAIHPSGAPVAYIVAGTGFADAVSAAPAAARDGGPVLLVGNGVVPKPTLAELKRLAPERIVIVGGTSVVSASVAATIAAAIPGATISRLAGADRYITSAAVAGTFGPGVPVVYVATGLNFADALAAAAAAGAQGAPVLLTHPTSLPAAVDWHIGRLEPQRAVIAGSSSAVSDGVLSAVRNAVAR
ncbi:MAG: cell wall-binding repeat-containing protein [Chloroflexi bacterium]|nr:cell wall-binding repeat-containing protein [Chloroflexota bacterium]